MKFKILRLEYPNNEESLQIKKIFPSLKSSYVFN